MKFLRQIFICIISLVLLDGCTSVTGHNDFINLKNSVIGKVMKDKVPYKYTDSGQIIRATYVISGQGLTDITKRENGDLVYHISVHEILENNRTNPNWVGKCLIYYVVEPSSYKIKSWGFDEGGNPLSCRTWP